MKIVADTTLSVKGVFSNVITIFSDNNLVNLGVDPDSGEAYKPIITNNNRVYIPVRAIAEAFGRDVYWNNSTKRVDLVDSNKVSIDKLQKQIKDIQKENDDLKVKIKQLESQLDGKIYNLKDLEIYLDENYYYYKGVRFYIYVDGNTKDIEISIYIDSRDNKSWALLEKNDIELYIGDIVYDIKYNFADAVVSGYIENEYTRKRVADFNLDSRGKVYINTDYAGTIKDLDQMADYINKNHSKFQKTDFHVKLYWDEEFIRADVFVGDNEWFQLGSTNREKYLKEVIYKEICKEFPNNGIYGYVLDNHYSNPYSNYIMQSFAFDYSGKLYIE